MTSQPPQRPRRNASPRSGPIRAMVPFSLRQNSSPTRGLMSSNGRRSSPGPGPVSSPTQPRSSSNDSHKAKHHRAQDQRASPERSPSSPGFKVEKPKAVRASPGPSTIRRTSSLDTITAPYLCGQWPKELPPTTPHVPGGGNGGAYEPNQIHQSTQTEDPDRSWVSHKRSSSLGSADNLKEKYRQQLRKQGSRQSSNSNQRASPVQGYHSTIPGYQAPPSPSPLGGSHSSGGSYSGPMNTRSSSAISIPTASSSLKPPPPRIRGSVEGLNQEIEKLVLKGLDRETDDGVGEMDGHRAPVPGVSTMRSIDTQTPRDNQEDSSNSDGGNESTSRSHSVSPSSPPLDGGSRPSSRSSSAGNGDNKDIKEVPEGSPDLNSGPRYSSSPSHNKSCQLTRDPPDGCEKVKTIDDPSPKHKSLGHVPVTHCPDKKMYIPLKPSDSSAFCLPNLPQLKSLIPPTITTGVAQTQTEEQS